MRTVRTFCVMGGLLACLLLVVGITEGQAPPSDSKLELPVPERSPTPPAAPQAQSIEQILNGIEDVRAKKAALEKQEQALLASLRERVKQQSERMAKMGIRLEEPQPKAEVKEDTAPRGFDIPPLVVPRKDQAPK